jgi:outer membrane immunogenic protein
MKSSHCFAALLVLGSISGVASAQAQYVTAEAAVADWRGFYAGLNIGGAWNTTCDTWSAHGPLANTAAFDNRDCPNNSSFVGGLQLGYNFQYGNLVWGIGLDFDGLSSKDRSRSLTYGGALVPAGTYDFSGKTSPDGFLILGPRIGYAIDQWLPYFRVGGVHANGSSHSEATFTPLGGSAPTASFNGGKNYKTNGWVVGVGTEFLADGPWTIRAEYLYVNIGKGSGSDRTCNGSPTACAVFNGAELDNIHNSFTASLFRVGFNYKFGPF